MAALGERGHIAPGRAMSLSVTNPNGVLVALASLVSVLVAPTTSTAQTTPLPPLQWSSNYEDFYGIWDGTLVFPPKDGAAIAYTLTISGRPGQWTLALADGNPLTIQKWSIGPDSFVMELDSPPFVLKPPQQVIVEAPFSRTSLAIIAHEHSESIVIQACFASEPRIRGGFQHGHHR